MSGATRAIYRPPGLKLFITTDCVVAFKDICPNSLLVVFDFIWICRKKNKEIENPLVFWAVSVDGSLYVRSFRLNKICTICICDIK